MNIVFLRTGLPTLPDDQGDVDARGQILAFVVDDLEGELARMQAEGVPLTMPLTLEEWGDAPSRCVTPNGIIIQIVDWEAATS